jgi:hypothetical protein
VDITLAATDPDGDALTYSVVAQPSEGDLTGSPPNVTYTPGSGFTGTDSFTWKASDGVDESNVATVTIEVSSDSDGDGLPDSWEEQYGLDPSNPDTDGDGILDAYDDDDGDGLTNMQEFLTGSDPTTAEEEGVLEGSGIGCGPGAFGTPLAVLAILAAACAGVRRRHRLSTSRAN